jgi:hypothetical protein
MERCVTGSQCFVVETTQGFRIREYEGNDINKDVTMESGLIQKFWMGEDGHQEAIVAKKSKPDEVRHWIFNRPVSFRRLGLSNLVKFRLRFDYEVENFEEKA